MISAPSCFIFQKASISIILLSCIIYLRGETKASFFCIGIALDCYISLYINKQIWEPAKIWWTSSSYQQGRTLLPSCPQRSQSVQAIRPCGLRKISMRCVHQLLGKTLPEKTGAAPHKGLALAALGPSEHAPKKSRKNTSLLSTANLIHSRCFLQPSPPHKPIFWDASWPDRTDQWNCTVAISTMPFFRLRASLRASSSDIFSMLGQIATEPDGSIHGWKGLSKVKFRKTFPVPNLLKTFAFRLGFTLRFAFLPFAHSFLLPFAMLLCGTLNRI